MLRFINYTLFGMVWKMLEQRKNLFFMALDDGGNVGVFVLKCRELERCPSG